MKAVELELGIMPLTLKEMLSQFNGAKLFVRAIPFLRLFRVSTVPAPSPLEWAPEWCIDTYTRKWREADNGRDNDWAFAITNYGGLLLLDETESIKEWDTQQGVWLARDVLLTEWIEKMICDGEQMMNDP